MNESKNDDSNSNSNKITVELDFVQQKSNSKAKIWIMSKKHFSHLAERAHNRALLDRKTERSHAVNPVERFT